jgi:Zn-dependent protease with chaperone function
MPKLSSEQRITIAALCFCLAVPVSSARPDRVYQTPRELETSQTPQIPANEDFKFTKVDLELLEQVNLLDRRFEREGLVLEDDATNAYLKRIGDVLVPRGWHLEHVEWKFRALRDPVPNAFALPNGSIYVSTGLLALMDNESQVAAVLAHEMTHVMRRHTYLQNRSNRKKFLTVNVIELVAGLTPGAGGMLLFDAIALISPVILQAMIAGYSRDLEREADLKGVELMANAEYPPEEMVKALELLSNDIEGEQIRIFYNDHPSLRDRVKYVSAHIGARADKITPAMELNREKNAYFAKAEGVMRHDIQLAINAGRFRSAVYLAQRLVDFHPDSENLFWLAEAYRTLGPRAPELTEKELTNKAKMNAAKKREKRTFEEEERELLATPAGQENSKSHQQKAEELYLRALAPENPVPMAHRGLGLLYEKLGRTNDAVNEYQKYVELAPISIDHERIQKRIESLRRTPP